MALIERLEKMGACFDSMEWVAGFPHDISPQIVWATCHRPSWLFWVVSELGGTADQKRIACDFATATRDRDESQREWQIRMCNSIRDHIPWTEIELLLKEQE